MKVLNFNTVFHVGTMDVGDKGEFSYEGDGLSVSMYPNEWQRIARLSGKTQELANSTGSFADYYAFGDDKLIKWGLSNSYIFESTLYRVTGYDENEEEYYRDYLSRDEAVAEVKSNGDEDLASLSEVRGFVPTDLLKDAISVKTNHMIYKDHLFGLYVQKYHPSLDGVWFDDTLDELALSAPRGMIFKHKINDWEIANH